MVVVVVNKRGKGGFAVGPIDIAIAHTPVALWSKHKKAPMLGVLEAHYILEVDGTNESPRGNRIHLRTLPKCPTRP